MTQTNLEAKYEHLVEPYNPEYLSNIPYEVPQLSAYEKRWLRKVSIVENKLVKERIRFEWLADWECFRVRRYVNGSEYPQYRYIRINMDENDYSFGTEKEDMVWDGKISVVMVEVKKWVNATFKSK